MKALLIKPNTSTVEEVIFNGTLDHAYELLKCNIIERVSLENGEDVWIDEEGLIDNKGLGLFIIEGNILTGYGLVTGTAIGEDGETWDDVRSDADAIRQAVRFMA